MDSPLDLEFDPEKYYLGVLCKRSHEWSGSGQTLRRRGDRACVVCKREHYRSNGKKYYQGWAERNQERTREKRNAYHRDWARRNPNKNNAKTKRYRNKNQGRACEYSRTQYQKHRLKRLEYFRNRPRTPQSRLLHAICQRRRRARKRENIIIPYTKKELYERRSVFEGRCAYCNKESKLSIDHFIPIAFGGPDAMANLMPACVSCNSSKGDSDPYKWYRSQPFFNQKRWVEILEILGKTQDDYQQITFL